MATSKREARNAFVGIDKRSFMVVLRPRDNGGWDAEAHENQNGKLKPMFERGFAAGRDQHETLGHAVARISRKIAEDE